MNIDARPALLILVVQLAAAAGGAGCARTDAAELPPLLDELFQDHAVLQRDRPIPVWGEAMPGEEVSVSLDATRVRVRADASGHWQAQLPALPAGGPHELAARAASGASRSITDLLVGDVWLCSGQSNMEFPVSNSLNAAREINGSANALIRLLTVAHNSSPGPLEHFATPVAWQGAGPDTIRDFSAACFYFARELQKAVPVPLGLIHASWGGSRIEPWMSDAVLRRLGGFDQSLDLLRLYAKDSKAGERSFGALWEQWWRARAPRGSQPWKADADDAAQWHEVPEPLRDWKTWEIPELKNHDGMVWYKRYITLTPAQAAGPAALSLGAIDEVDETWVNGRPVGNSFGWGTERTYPLAAGILHAGENSIVVNVLSTWDAGGMYGPAEHMVVRCADGGAVPLGGKWRYQFVPASLGYPPRAPWESISGLTSLYNGMIAPIGHYGLRGVLWYQGESNTGEADRYQVLLAGLMAGWRSRFGAELPFLVVQLPNFGAPRSTPAPADWAALREAQRRAVAADSHASLAVTIDVGENQELHPPNKQDVGRRLARAARHLVYGERISASGPVPLAAQRDADTVAVSFGDLEGGLVAYSAKRPIGFELCAGEQSTCRFVDADIHGDRVVLDAARADAATRVRYCWGDAPVCNLHDASGLPAGPFEIAIRP